MPRRSQRFRVSTVQQEHFLGDGEIAAVLLGVHHVDNPSDSDSTRLDALLRYTKIDRAVGVTDGDMDNGMGFCQQNFKARLPASVHVHIMMLDYYWMQRGGDWIALRYGKNWHEKIQDVFSESPHLEIVLVPNVTELFDNRDPSDLTFRTDQGVVLCVRLIGIDEATMLHPLVVATRARDRSTFFSDYVHTWVEEGRVDAHQRVRYAAEGFWAVYRLDSEAHLLERLADLCACPEEVMGEIEE